MANVESIFMGEEEEFSLSNTLSHMIEQSRIFQQGHYYSYNWMDDFCTIALRGNRGIGHTKAIIDVIIEKSLNSVIYVHSYAAIRSVKQFLFNRLQEESFNYCQDEQDRVVARRHFDDDGNGSFTVYFCSAHNIKFTFEESISLDAVFVDPYSEISRDMEKIDKIKSLAYRYIATGSDFFFVGVG